MTQATETKAIDLPGVLLALQDIRQRAAWLEQRDRELHTYTHVSVRDLCVELGYGPLVDQVQACADGGFDYCLDHTVRHPVGAALARTDGTMGEPGYPPRTACLWGADQLRSRLDCVDYRVREPQQLYTVMMPGAFDSFWTGTGVAQGQQWSDDPVEEAGARQLRRAWERAYAQRVGKGHRRMLHLTAAAVQVLADYADACISSIEGSSDEGLGSELRAARQLRERCDRVLA